MTKWSVFSSHGLVLLHLAARPNGTIRELSDVLGITERHVTRVLADLKGAGVLSVRRRGRRNTYVLRRAAHFRHPSLSHIRLAEFVESVAAELPPTAAPAVTPRGGP